MLVIDIPDYKKIVVKNAERGFIVEDGERKSFFHSVFEDKSKLKDTFLYYLSLAVDYKDDFNEYKKLSCSSSKKEVYEEWSTAGRTRHGFYDLNWSEDDMGIVYDHLIYEEWKKTEAKERVKNQCIRKM